MAFPDIGKTTILNYGELVEAIKAYIDRTDLDKIIPIAIGTAEKKIFRDLRSPMNEQKTYFDALEPTYHFTLPNRTLWIKNIKMMTTPPRPASPPITVPPTPPAPEIIYQDQTGAQSLDFVPLAVFHTPKAFYLNWTRDIDQLYFKGGIPANNRVIIVYYQDLSGMNDPLDTNEVLLKMWDAYLYGALAELSAYIIDDDRIPLWAAKFAEVMQQAQSYYHKLDYMASPNFLRRPT